MALGANYITSAQLKSYMGLTTSSHDAEVAFAISSASREIEDFCNRQFNDAGTVSARVFHPQDRLTCVVDDFSTATGLIVKTDVDGDGVYETTWTSADYELNPLNGIQDGKPWVYSRVNAVGYTNWFPYHQWRISRRASVQVTAQWGWATVPDPVFQACLILASDTFQLKDQRLGVAGSDAFGTIVRVKDSRMAAAKLIKYQRDRILVDG